MDKPEAQDGHDHYWDWVYEGAELRAEGAVENEHDYARGYADGYFDGVKLFDALMKMFQAIHDSHYCKDCGSALRPHGTLYGEMVCFSCWDEYRY